VNKVVASLASRQAPTPSPPHCLTTLIPETSQARTTVLERILHAAIESRDGDQVDFADAFVLEAGETESALSNERGSTHSNGFKISIPHRSKSLTLRVARAKWWVRAMAAI